MFYGEALVNNTELLQIMFPSKTISNEISSPPKAVQGFSTFWYSRTPKYKKTNKIVPPKNKQIFILQWKPLNVITLGKR